MIGFLEDLWGVRLEPLAGITLVLFDPEATSERENLKAAASLRMFVIHCRTGSCDLEAFGERVHLGMGDACVVSCSNAENVRCSLRSSPDYSGCLLGLARREFPEATRRTLRAFDVDVAAFERVAEQGSRVCLLQRRWSLDHAYALLYALPRRSPLGLVRLRVIELGFALSRGSWQRSEIGQPHKPTHEEIACRAQEVMTRDLSHPLTIPATAELCGTSATVLKQSFKETYGMSVHEWYRACRMRYAARLLETTSYSVAQISSEVGYSNPSKFSKVFAQHMGSTPSVWRASHRAIKSAGGSGGPFGVVRSRESL